VPELLVQFRRHELIELGLSFLARIAASHQFEQLFRSLFLVVCQFYWHSFSLLIFSSIRLLDLAARLPGHTKPESVSPSHHSKREFR
jgi:hypothetical protein